MSDSRQKDWEEFIERIKRCGAGEYGSAHFMCSKHEHWKMLWAAERIAELEAENKLLVDRPSNQIIAELRQQLSDIGKE